MEKNLESLKYPIGKFTPPTVITSAHISQWIGEIAELPGKVKSVAERLDEKQLNTSYRPGGWTIRQVIHHLPDSHMNAYVRFKWAITEESPVIKPYYEDRWAECDEAKNGEITISLVLLESLHKRWVEFLKSLSGDDLKRTYIHPEHGQIFRLESVIGMYAWHGNHHLQHIINAF
ncbi:MAG: metal-dependent hydrolase [Daejeonella sp.]|nr:metal-dependent hydrolase [Daejeonella sp.]